MGETFNSVKTLMNGKVVHSDWEGSYKLLLLLTPDGVEAV